MKIKDVSELWEIKKYLKQKIQIRMVFLFKDKIYFFKYGAKLILHFVFDQEKINDKVRRKILHFKMKKYVLIMSQSSLKTCFRAIENKRSRDSTLID